MLILKHGLKVSTDETSQSSRLQFESFLSDMTRWFSDHQLQVDELFSNTDADRSGSVNLKDFHLGNPPALCASMPKAWMSFLVIFCDFIHQHPQELTVETLVICFDILQSLFQLLWMSDHLEEIRKRYSTWVSINQMPQCGCSEVFMEGAVSHFLLSPSQIRAAGSGKQNQDNVPFVWVNYTFVLKAVWGAPRPAG